MKIFKSTNDPQLVELLRRGAIGVIPTDTLYGIVASAAFPGSIARLYQVRQRPAQKGCIILLADKDQADEFVSWQPADRKLAEKYWPGPVSIVLPVHTSVPKYLHPVDGTLAFRVPKDKALRALLAQTGPLLAPSANIAGEKPAVSFEEAKLYFGDAIDFYVAACDLSGNQPSVLIRRKGEEIEMLRGSLPT